ncbi:MAG: GNAT family N-acetyltransferase [Planctomycetaceae bacterium]
MFEILIRSAILADHATIVRFNLQLADESEGLTLDQPTVERGVRAALEDQQKGRYLVACCGKEVIGQLMVTREWSDWRDGVIWWVQSVYVDPRHRHQGVFRKLFATLQAEAESRPDVVGIRLYVERDNSAAQHVYERLGLVDSGYHVLEQMFPKTK